MNDYTVTIPRPPNRYRPLGAPLTEAQRRGKLIFERTRTQRRPRDPARGPLRHLPLPAVLHRPHAARRRHEAPARTRSEAKFDVPHLNNIYDSAPYLHNGMADTLEEIWTVYNPNDTHGVTNDMTKDQLNDLIEYLKTL